jgi:hypothetical protein
MDAATLWLEGSGVRGGAVLGGYGNILFHSNGALPRRFHALKE